LSSIPNSFLFSIDKKKSAIVRPSHKRKEKKGKETAAKLLVEHDTNRHTYYTLWGLSHISQGRKKPIVLDGSCPAPLLVSAMLLVFF
jgi:hypothetical protein